MNIIFLNNETCYEAGVDLDYVRITVMQHKKANLKTGEVDDQVGEKQQNPPDISEKLQVRPPDGEITEGGMCSLKCFAFCV